jgi:hypothetical protein
VAPDAAGDLDRLVETIKVTAYPTPTPNPPALVLTRDNATGAVTTIGSGDGTMPNQTSVRIDITAQWVAKGGSSASRQFSLVLSNGGIQGRH